MKEKAMIYSRVYKPRAVFRPALHYAKPLLASFVTIIFIWFGLETSEEAKLTLLVFALATIAWVLTPLDDTLIAVSAALVLPLIGISSPETFFASLGDSLIWLLVASFMLSAAISKTGLLQRLARLLILKAHTVNQLFVWLSVAIFATVFFVPSTSGRAALLLPVFVALEQTLNNRRLSRALAITFPVVILLSAFTSLIGAGGNLVTAELLAQMVNQPIGFGSWLYYALPFTPLSCAISVFVITRMFSTKIERQQALSNLNVLPEAKGRLSQSEVRVLSIVLLLITGWSTQVWHGIDATLLAIVAALLVTLPNFGVMKFKESLKSVEWTLILFLVATLELGEALIHTGAASHLVESAFAFVTQREGVSNLAVLIFVSLLALVSQLVINSRTARSSVLIPLIILLCVPLGFNPVVIGLLATAAFCFTLPVSAKPVALFSKNENASYTPKDLLRLSSVLLSIHVVLLLVFAYFIWPLQGLPLQQQTTLTSNQQVVTEEARDDC
jgi:solute carrier family 13 (sodium-dependent dicarboxylate transporter), member 2/3/5